MLHSILATTFTVQCAETPSKIDLFEDLILNKLRVSATSWTLANRHPREKRKPQSGKINSFVFNSDFPFSSHSSSNAPDKYIASIFDSIMSWPSTPNIGVVQLDQGDPHRVPSATPPSCRLPVNRRGSFQGHEFHHRQAVVEHISKDGTLWRKTYSSYNLILVQSLMMVTGRRNEDDRPEQHFSLGMSSSSPPSSCSSLLHVPSVSPHIALLAALYHRSTLERLKIGFKVSSLRCTRVHLFSLSVPLQEYHCATSITVS
ncbi:hypothetical protein EV363DRAFT_1306010 [Boletus edulis]|nr:hypothetical protein EV363DRAFT_1306010 [Boletus edulis]